MEESPGAALGLTSGERRSSQASVVQTSSISYCAVFSYSLLPIGLSPGLSPADSDSKIQAEQVCWPRGMEYVSLQLPIPHFVRPLYYLDVFTLPKQASQQGSLSPKG